MREYHLKVVASRGDEPREEIIVGAPLVGYNVFSALFGDGKDRYADVTKTVQQWGSSWPEDWEARLYKTKKPRAVVTTDWVEESAGTYGSMRIDGLQIHSALYGISASSDDMINVTERVRNLVQNDSLDIVVNNATLTPEQNPFRGKRKFLQVVYSYNGGDSVKAQRWEKEALIIGQPQQKPDRRDMAYQIGRRSGKSARGLAYILNGQNSTAAATFEQQVAEAAVPRLVEHALAQVGSAAALNDFLIRKFSISAQRLRAPMPIELRDFHRDDLAKLFAELGFTKGAEVGVAEGHYSEILCKAIPNLELLCVDPWHSYSANPQNHSKEHQEFSYNETVRRLKGYNAKLDKRYSMDAVRDVKEGSLDFVYVDANHKFNFVMRDIIEWSKVVRSGGIVAGDDYYELSAKWNDGGVPDAVQAYTKANRIGVWYIFQGHKSVDFMWVNP